MNLLCICDIYDWFGVRDNWKDLIIPTVSPILGVAGAYWVAKKQLFSTEENKAKEDLTNKHTVLESYIRNLRTILEVLPDVQSKFREIHYELNNSVSISPVHLTLIDLVKSYDFVNLDLSLSPLINKYQEFNALFQLSYDAILNIEVIINSLNKHVQDYQSFNSKFNNFLLESEFNIISSLGNILNSYKDNNEVIENMNNFIDKYFIKYDREKRKESLFEFVIELKKYLHKELYSYNDMSLINMCDMILTETKKIDIVNENILNSLIYETKKFDIESVKLVNFLKFFDKNPDFKNVYKI